MAKSLSAGLGDWMTVARKQSHLCGLPSVHFVSSSQLPVSVISLHKDPAKFIYQAKMIIAKSTEEDLGRLRQQKASEPLCSQETQLQNCPLANPIWPPLPESSCPTYI